MFNDTCDIIFYFDTFAVSIEEKSEHIEFHKSNFINIIKLINQIFIISSNNSSLRINSNKSQFNPSSFYSYKDCSCIQLQAYATSKNKKKKQTGRSSTL